MGQSTNMARYSSDRSSYASREMMELLFDEIRTFHSENRNDYKHIEEILSSQKDMLMAHSEQLVKLTQTIHGDGNKGLIDRINAIEKVQTEFAAKFASIETKEKVRAAVLGVICALCSSIGGIITYIISIYISTGK